MHKGDIDIMIMGKNVTDAERLDLELKFTVRFQSICDEKIDVVVFDITRLASAEEACLAFVGTNKLPLAA